MSITSTDIVPRVVSNPQYRLVKPTDPEYRKQLRYLTLDHHGKTREELYSLSGQVHRDRIQFFSLLRQICTVRDRLFPHTVRYGPLGSVPSGGIKSELEGGQGPSLEESLHMLEVKVAWIHGDLQQMECLCYVPFGWPNLCTDNT